MTLKITFSDLFSIKKAVVELYPRFTLFFSVAMEKLQQENELLRKKIAELEAKEKTPVGLTETDVTSTFERVSKLTNEEIYRFGRQMVNPGFGLECKAHYKKLIFVGKITLFY